MGPIGNLIAADASVHKHQLPVGKFFAKFACDDELVTMTENVIGIAISAALAIGDRIALQQNVRTPGKNGHRVGDSLRNSAWSKWCRQQERDEQG